MTGTLENGNDENMGVSCDTLGSDVSYDRALGSSYPGVFIQKTSGVADRPFGASIQKCRALAERGMTLIELVVVMAIIAIMFVVGAVGISAIRGADVDASASVIAGAMTYVSSLAVHENKTFRLVLDMDQKGYWVEAVDTDDPCARFLPDEVDVGLEDKSAETPEDIDEEDAAPAASFSQQAGDLLKGRLEPGTNVAAILTSHHDQPQEGGRSAIYFYPNGQAERALVWIGAASAEANSGWDREVTIELHSLGRVTRHGDPLDERDFDLQKPEEVK